MWLLQQCMFSECDFYNSACSVNVTFTTVHVQWMWLLQQCMFSECDFYNSACSVNVTFTTVHVQWMWLLQSNCVMSRKEVCHDAVNETITV